MAKTADMGTEKSIRTGSVARVEKPKTGVALTKQSYAAPQGHQVLLKVQACGVCHSDSFALEGSFPGLAYPLVPGHEIVGVVEEVGANVARLKKGDRVGVGWHGGHCGECESCRRGDFITCQKLEIPGITKDGGYAEYAIFDEAVCALVPEKLSSAEAAPLMCAGVTTYNSLRHAGALPGDIVAILGLGGLGHLGVQFASKMGFNTVAIARGKEKAEFAKELGANHYIDSESQNAVEELVKLGGAKVLLSTITNSKAMSPWVNGLAIGGRMLLVGADVQPMEISPIALLARRLSVTGWPSGTATDSEDCLNFAALMGIRPMIEMFPLNRAEQAVERMLSGKARFRAVIEVSK